MTSIDLPEHLVEIGKDAFSWCTGLKSIEVPYGIGVIREKTFFNCNNLASVVLPEGLRTIEDKAFSFCEKLKKIEGVDLGNVTVHENAFQNSGYRLK